MPRRNWAEIDRAHGQGLPYSLNIERLAARLGHAQEETDIDHVRVASRAQAMAAGFEPRGVSREEGELYKRGHALWALETSPDGEGYVLIRRREERAVDHRTADYVTAPATTVPALEVGQKVAIVHRGQVVDAIIVLLDSGNGGQMADLEVPATEEHVLGVPADQLLLTEGSDPSPFDPCIQPSSKLVAQKMDDDKTKPTWPQWRVTEHGQEAPYGTGNDDYLDPFAAIGNWIRSPDGQHEYEVTGWEHGKFKLRGADGRNYKVTPQQLARASWSRMRTHFPAEKPQMDEPRGLPTVTPTPSANEELKPARMPRLPSDTQIEDTAIQRRDPLLENVPVDLPRSMHPENGRLPGGVPFKAKPRRGV